MVTFPFDNTTGEASATISLTAISRGNFLSSPCTNVRALENNFARCGTSLG
jgi:hypothetical protein